MEKFQTTGTAPQSGFTAPTLGGALAGVCPQAGLLVLSHDVTTRDRQVIAPSAGFAAAAMGHRSWSPPIT